MTAHPGITFNVFPQHAVEPRRAGWPWITSSIIFLAFFLAVHDVQASHRWLKTEKNTLSELKAEESGGRAIRQVGFLLLGAVGMTLLVLPGSKQLQPSPLLLLPLSMLLLWTSVSAAWSADWALTLKRQVVLLCMILAAAGLIKRFTLSQLAEIVLVQSLLVVIVGVIVEAILGPVLPISNGEYRFAGTLHPNHMGINASLLILSSVLVALQRRDRRIYIVTVIGIATLMMTKSRTALSSAVIGSLVFFILAYPRKRFALMLSLLLTSGVVMAVIATDAASSLGQTVLMNRGSSDPTTLTGRTMIWQFALDQVRSDWGRIFTGFGYGGFWTPEMAAALSRRANFALSEGHNAYLDVMLQLGIPGVGLYLFCVIGALIAWVSLARRTTAPQAAFAAGLICFALNHHLAESALTAPSFPTLTLWFVIGSAALARESETNLGGTH